MTNAISVSITMHHHLYLTFMLILIKDTNSRQLKKMKYYDYLGCYKKEYRPPGVLPWFFNLRYEPLQSSSLSLCLLHCKVNQFKLAALDNANCGCAHEIGDLANKKTDEGLCTFICSMEPFPNTPCGGPQYMSVYEVRQSSILNVYVGCYFIQTLDRTRPYKLMSENSPFAHDIKQLDDATASYCVKHCAKSGFNYAAIHHGLTCGCDHVVEQGRVLSVILMRSVYCTYPCVDLKMGTCGAQVGPMVSIYRCDDFGLKWMKEAIDTTFLKKELAKTEKKELAKTEKKELGKTEKKEIVKNTKKVDGRWSEWKTWSTCSVTCGDGQQTRSRTCTNPAPENGGNDCYGETSESKSCNHGSCPIDGRWSEWKTWSTCSVTCGDGQQTRSRTCTNPAPENGGNDCYGETSESKSCNHGSCPKIKAIDTTILKKEMNIEDELELKIEDEPELKIEDEPAEGSDESERKLGKIEKKDDYYDEADAKDEKEKKEKREEKEGEEEGAEEGAAIGEKTEAKEVEEESDSNSRMIIGGCVTGVLIVGGGVGRFIWWKRKQKAGGGKSKSKKDEDDDDDDDGEEKKKKKAEKEKSSKKSSDESKKPSSNDPSSIDDPKTPLLEKEK